MSAALKRQDVITGTRAGTGTAIASPANEMVPARPRRNQTCKTLILEWDVDDLLVAEYRSLIAYARRLTSNGPEAVDLVHMVCARVLAQRTAIPEVENLSSWVRTILFNAFVDSRRRSRWEIPTESAALDRPTNAPEVEASVPLATVDDVRSLLSALPAHYRVPYELFTFEGMPYARIAAVLGLPCTTVGTRINRARRKLRRLLGERYGA